MLYGAAWRGATQQIPGIKLMPHSNYNVLTLSTNDLQWSLCHIQCRQTLRCIARGICVYAPHLLWMGDVMRCQTELWIRCVAPLAEPFKHQCRCQPIRSPYSNTLANRIHATPEKYCDWRTTWSTSTPRVNVPLAAVARHKNCCIQCRHSVTLLLWVVFLACMLKWSSPHSRMWFRGTLD